MAPRYLQPFIRVALLQPFSSGMIDGRDMCTSRWTIQLSLRSSLITWRSNATSCSCVCKNRSHGLPPGLHGSRVTSTCVCQTLAIHHLPYTPGLYPLHLGFQDAPSVYTKGKQTTPYQQNSLPRGLHPHRNQKQKHHQPCIKPVTSSPPTPMKTNMKHIRRHTTSLSCPRSD